MKPEADRNSSASYGNGRTDRPPSMLDLAKQLKEIRIRLHYLYLTILAMWAGLVVVIFLGMLRAH